MKCCDLSSTFNFIWIFFVLADKKDNYKSLDEFEFHQDLITYYGVRSPGTSKKLMESVVTTLAPSFLIGSFSFFQVTRTTIKAWMSLNFK